MNKIQVHLTPVGYHYIFSVIDMFLVFDQSVDPENPCPIDLDSLKDRVVEAFKTSKEDIYIFDKEDFINIIHLIESFKSDLNDLLYSSLPFKFTSKGELIVDSISVGENKYGI